MIHPYSTLLLQPNHNTAISLPQAKEFLKISHNEDDKLLHKMIRAVERRAESITNIALLKQIWNYRYRDFISNTIRLSITPIINVQNIIIGDRQGSKSLLSADHYNFENDEIKFLVTPFAYNLDIEFSAGYKSAADIDEDLIAEMLTHLSFLYERRSIYINPPKELYSRFKKLNL